ncbi:MAG: ISAs1 family transposase [Candidatus Electrothrix sp. YB6]
MLNTIKDHRRGQGRRYELTHILLFSIMAILSGSDSYRKIHLFVDAHRERLNEYFGLDWKKAPAYTTIRTVILNTSGSELERIFREHGKALAEEEPDGEFIHCDGKTLRGSFDNMKDINQLQILSAFAGDRAVVLGHEEIREKSNEIPAARKLMKELGLSDRIFTFDALHCQKKTLQAAAETGNDVIAQVKKNQKTLLNDCENIANTSVPDDVFTGPFEKKTKPYRESQSGSFSVPAAYGCEKMEFGRSRHQNRSISSGV